MKTKRYCVQLENVPVDFFADPDGDWDYFRLLEAAGFEESQGVCIGALSDAYRSHPAGSAVVTLNAKDRPYLAIIECDPLLELEAPADVRAKVA